MTIEQLVGLVTLVLMIAMFHVTKNRHRIKQVFMNRLNLNPEKEKHASLAPLPSPDESETRIMSAEESEAELNRLQMLIEDRKRVAWNSDIAHHLWGLYKNLLLYTNPNSMDQYIKDGQWYDIEILKVSSQNGLNTLEFELKGAKYKFVDDEEKQGWRELMKSFSLFLYDDSDRCLIEIPMKMKVDDTGRNYSISTGGPNAFLLGGWISDFINVKLKHQRIRNQEIRAQKHQERLSEIDDLKGKFGILD